MEVCSRHRITLFSSITVCQISLMEEYGRNLRYCGWQQKKRRRDLTLKVRYGDMGVKLFSALAVEITKGNNHKLQLGQFRLDTEYDISIRREG